MVVLLVDDNAGDRLMLCEAMGQASIGQSFHVVEDGDDAIRFLFRQPPHEQAPRPDLIIMDLRLPAMSGVEVMQEVHGKPDFSDIPLVLMTGVARAEEDYCSHWSEDRCLYLPKPLNFEGLP